MTDDLVKRLRDWQPKIAVGYHSPAAANTIGEAADRIEQLEAALDDMAQYVSRADWHYLKPETRAAPVPDLQAVEALASYQQADEDGVMVLVSRQAIEECLPSLRKLAASAKEG